MQNTKRPKMYLIIVLNSAIVTTKPLPLFAQRRDWDLVAIGYIPDWESVWDNVDRP